MLTNIWKKFGLFCLQCGFFRRKTREATIEAKRKSAMILMNRTNNAGKTIHEEEDGRSSDGQDQDHTQRASHLGTGESQNRTRDK